MNMTGTVLDITVGRSLLIRNDATGEEIVVNTRNTNPFGIGDRVSVTYNGVMTRSFPPQITATNIQHINQQTRPPVTNPRPPVTHPRPPITHPRPPVGIVPPIATLPVTREMRAQILRRENNFLIVRNNADGITYRVDSPDSRFFCPGNWVLIRHQGITMGLPPRVRAVDLTPIC